MASTAIGWLCLWVVYIVRCVHCSELDYGALLQNRPASPVLNAHHLDLVPPDCKWSGEGKEPSCDSLPATQRTLRSAPRIPERSELLEFYQSLRREIEVHQDASWLNPLWTAAEICIHDPGNCSRDVLNFMWRNFALVGANLLRARPTQDAVERAINLHRIALWLEPDEQTYQRLISVYTSVGRTTDAARTCQEAIAMNAANAEVLDQLGMIFHNTQKWAAAMFAFKAAHMMDPDDSLALNNLVYLRKRCADWDGIENQTAKLMTMVEKTWSLAQSEPEKAVQLQVNAHPWVFLYFPVCMVTKRVVAQMFANQQRALALVTVPTLPDMEEEAREDTDALLQEAATPAGAAAWSTGTRRIRIGFVSADFRRKATSYLIAHLFEEIDRKQIELFVYSTFPNDAKSCDWRKSMEAGAEHWVELAGMQPAQAIARIRQDKMDILLDMDGYSNEGQRLAPLFASRMAPVQMAYFVYIGTIGSQYIDYIVTDAVASPPSSAVGHVEKFLRVPHTFFPNSHARLFPPPHFGMKGVDRAGIRRALGVPPDGVILASFNKHLKMCPEQFQVWLSVLGRVPNAWLWLLRFPRDSEVYLNQLARAHGVQDRVLFSDFVDSAEANFQRLGAADLILDTTIYGAHTSAVDALWSGVGLLTCLGPNCVTKATDQASEYASEEFTSEHTLAIGADHMTARLSASMVVAAGLEDELVVTSLEEYEERAVALATNKSRMEKLRKRVAESRQARDSLFDNRAYAKKLVKGFRLAWENFLAGNRPMHIDSF
uniref:protein O-GlcNAc transferase n=2 Tax=Pyramimonas obovata TaxID=1411642 RepID=A0A7S0N0V8_9CHLO|mmetsp:Transcript_17047/g.37082  ORF Transcript_17047/g.37082 Transcript_17047/m.37082 type:complete len:772 (+) Transcript_17047:140-2455(+)